MKMVRCLIFYSLLYGFNCLLLDANPRQIVKTLTVSNGDAFGAWTTLELCPAGTYAIGYDMQIEPDQHGGDDTGLNSIKLICGSKDGHYGSTVTSGQGSWGSWVGATMCSYNDTQTYLSSFALQVEELLPGDRDDVAATYVKFWCRDLDLNREHEIAHPPGRASLGIYGNQSEKCSQDVPRKHIKTIEVSNGGWWGDWHPPHFCADGYFATGYNMKIEGNQHGHDDTSLNAILLRCNSFDGHYGGIIESGEGSYGDWVGWTDCEKSEAHNNQTYLTAFSLQVEGDQSGGDDTAANFIKFKCRDFDDDRDDSILAHPPGHGLFGRYGGWSESCATHSAICGIQTRIEGPQGGGIHGDDTSLNNVKFFCCAK